MSMYRDAVNLTPHGHPNKPIHLNNIGDCLVTRFERLGELSDLEDAISTLRDAIDLTLMVTLTNLIVLKPSATPSSPVSSASGSQVTSRMQFRVTGMLLTSLLLVTLTNLIVLTISATPCSLVSSASGLSDLEDAISTLRHAVDLTPHGHPDTPGRLSNLGNTFVIRFERFGELSDLEQAISLYLHAASAPIGPIIVRFHASQKWISCARRIHHHSLLHAYSIAISLLPELAWIGFSLTHRYYELTRGANVVREAAAAALDSGLPETAVEWLEQGRSIVWGELFQLRSSYEQLSSAHPGHAHRLRELSAALEHASSTREKSLSTLLEQTPSAAHGVSVSLQQEADRHRTLAVERDRLLQEIRRFPGFERFLLRKAVLSAPSFGTLWTGGHT
jgi:hypothetical protein